MSREVTLYVNDAPISLDYFVHGYIDHTLSGILASLEGTGEIKSLDLTIEGDKVTIDLNDALIPVNPFASKIIKSTITGMLSSLKGVGEISTMRVTIRR